MSHDIDETSGKPAMAYVGETPWHGLGEQLQPGQPIEAWVKAARLDWQIETLPVQYHFKDRMQIMSDRFVLARNDTGAALSIVSADYQVVQPKAVLEFYRDLVATRGYTLETAGALDGGRKVWALARTGLVRDVAGNAADQLGAYVLLATSCDKSLATTATFTSVRVVCQNTLSFAFDDVKGNKRRHIKVDHMKRFDARSIHEELGLIDGAWDAFMRQVDPMAAKKLSDAEARFFFENLFLSEKETQEGKPLSNAKSSEVNQLASLFRNGKGQNFETAKGTLWGAVNAVTDYVDHVRSARLVERTDSAWFGTGAALKEKAWQSALVLAGLNEAE